MMGKRGVGRIVGSIALVLGMLSGVFAAFSYGSATTHLEVTEAILGGYGGEDFQEFFDGTSGVIDCKSGGGESNAVNFRGERGAGGPAAATQFGR